MYLSSPLAGHDVWVGDGVGDGNISGRRVKAHLPILTKQTFENIIISIIDYLSMLMATKWSIEAVHVQTSTLGGEFNISKRFFNLLNFFTFIVIVIVGVKISPIIFFFFFSFYWKSKSRVTNMFQGCFKEFSKVSTMVSKMFQRYFRDAWCSNNVHRYLKMVSPQRCFLQIMFKYISNIFSHQMCWKI